MYSTNQIKGTITHPRHHHGHHDHRASMASASRAALHISKPSAVPMLPGVAGDARPPPRADADPRLLREYPIPLLLLLYRDDDDRPATHAPAASSGIGLWRLNALSTRAGPDFPLVIMVAAAGAPTTSFPSPAFMRTLTTPLLCSSADGPIVLPIGDRQSLSSENDCSSALSITSLCWSTGG